MIDLKFPDGASRQYPDDATGRDVAASISPSLAKRAALVALNGEQRDLDRPLGGSGDFKLIMRDDPEALETIRHDAAHVLAQAVQELFPGTQVTIGPAIEDGFYYDFHREEPFSTDDFAAIEKKMAEIVDRDEKLVRQVWDRDEAIKLFEAKGETFKAELIRDLPGTETITTYATGDWVDLCRGPHFPSTKFVGKAFKLTKLAGAYWRGDHRNPQLQRIYATAWASKEDLDAYLLRVEEAEKRDHRKLGRQMELFHMQEEGRGMVFWHPKGWILWRELESYLRRRLDAAGYQEIKTPQVMDRVFWEKSGHWEKYRPNMFVCETEEGEVLAVKPMSCPGHVQVFNVGQRSYRELPLRFAEYGSCHRYEPSGSLHGLMRVRAFTQDDGHIFCREDQITDEAKAFIDLLMTVYEDLGMVLTELNFSTRPEVRAGDDATWDRAEAELLKAIEAAGVNWTLNEGDGAFYGPKLDFKVKDAIGRTWQCGTFQLDMVLPERLDALYTGEDGNKHRPVMLHRAILGSFERFLGILIENYAGAFPLWLAPTQAVVATIVSEADEYAREVVRRFKAAGLRTDIDLRNEKVGYKVREHSVGKVPVIAVVGKNEAEAGTVAIRRLGSQAQEVVSLDEAIRILTEEATPPDLRPA
jgi:threonyl-tRNA synthetase